MTRTPIKISPESLYRSEHVAGLILAALVSMCCTTVVRAADSVPTVEQPPVAASAAAVPETWALHGQITNVTQGHRRFTSPYSGANSLVANGRTEETTDITLYAGVRLWRGAQLWINPEIDQGFGLSNTVGLAGFSSGEAYKVGANTPYLRMPRLFLRQVVALGDAVIQVGADANQLAGPVPADNLTLTVGKFSVTDIFDTNSYAHDPRADFLNWSVIDAGAFDYAADAWGFTYGAAAEWTRDAWTVRGGVFQLSRRPNGKITGIDFGQFMLVSELEQRHDWRGHPGKLKLLAFVNRAPMGAYSDAVALAAKTGQAPDTALVRRRASRPGATVNLEQELRSDLGVFLRASVNRGDQEAYEFTEINRSVSGGVSLKGERWGRNDDRIGVAVAVNALSADARRYFAVGGTGILIGDGQLRAGNEKIVEAYYAFQLDPHATLALNYQHVHNPAHNRDRGPVSIFSARVHAQF